MSLDAATIAGFKVTELKAELEQRGLPTTGKKADLAARLTEAVENEAANGAEEQAPAEAEEEAAVEEVEEPAAPAAAAEEVEPAAPAAAEEEPAAAEAAAAPAESGAAEEEVELDEFELAKKKRAERFGIPYEPPKKEAAPEDEDPIEKIKRQRAERFGLPYEPPKSTFAPRRGLRTALPQALPTRCRRYPSPRAALA